MVEEVNITFKTKMQWFKAVILGFLIGLAVILPGISGATIAIIFGLYSAMIYSFGNIFKEFKKCFLFLLPIAIGLVIGAVVGFFFVREVYEIQPFIVICLFAGLMIGSFPIVKDEISGIKWGKKSVFLLVLGILIPIAIGIMSILIQVSSSGLIVATPGLIAFYFVIGFIVSLTQILPGLSCSALLMAFGQFGAILSSVHVDYLIENPLVIVALLALVIGFAVGIIVFSKLLGNLLKKRKLDTFTLIVGLSLGSIVTMFLNPDIYAVYTSWQSGLEVGQNLASGAFLLTVGLIISYLLVLYQRKVNAKNKNEESQTSIKTEEANK